MGTDIADLLLEGHEPDSRAYSRASVPSQIVEDSANTSVSDDSHPATSTVDANSAELSDRFRHLLLHGRKKVNAAVSDMLRFLCELVIFHVFCVVMFCAFFELVSALCAI